MLLWLFFFASLRLDGSGAIFQCGVKARIGAIDYDRVLTHCGLVTPYVYIDVELDQYWLFSHNWALPLMKELLPIPPTRERFNRECSSYYSVKWVDNYTYAATSPLDQWVLRYIDMELNQFWLRSHKGCPLLRSELLFDLSPPSPPAPTTSHHLHYTHTRTTRTENSFIVSAQVTIQ